MTIRTCPHCHEKFVTMAGAGNMDFEHNCNYGDKALDEEDVVEIRTVHWNLQGLSDGMARMQSDAAPTVTDRGHRASTHYQRKKHTFINLPNNKNIVEE